VAARRLIILMLALLVASSVAAALVPVDPDRLRRSSTTSTTTAPAAPLGKLVRQTIDADRGEPARIAIALGDQLTLTVTGSRPDLVEIAGLGELEDLDPDSPARFDLRPFEARTYPVRLLDPGETIARIEVTAGKSARRGDDAAK
jgi:hypothetical protein